ncbi:MAG: polysulfide reductase NrfD [Ardenticatenaceae bacterium]|nr:polysulfide reductase NrfD [Ardenticatenaceae bacterium]HBY92450.1 hypothetical protein [Chloroflexota bacterium]
MELIQPMKQRVWKWPAVVNFTLGGLGTGFYLVGLAAGAPEGAGFVQLALFKLLGPLLASLGFLALTTEAGRPLRGYNLLRHLRRSWMSRETLAAAVFIPAAAADWFFPHPVLKGLAGAAALGLMISQGFIVYRARGVTAWNVPLMPLFFVTSAFATGSGLMVLLVALGGSSGLSGSASFLLPVGLISLALNLALWLLYLSEADPAFQQATKTLRRPDTMTFVVGMGHLLPALLMVVALGSENTPLLRAITAAVAGASVIAGGVSQKSGVILGAGYLRAIALGVPYQRVHIRPEA